MVPRKDNYFYSNIGEKKKKMVGLPGIGPGSKGPQPFSESGANH
jgi:hypothetical protein